MKYDPDIHHRRSIRLEDFDYSSNGAYFVTVCAQNRKPLFGEVSIDRVILNECGGIARDEWIRTADVRPNVEIDEFVIMPNHIHGIILILPDDIDMQNRRGVLHTPIAQINDRIPDTERRGLNCTEEPRKGQCNWPLRTMPKSPSNNLGAFIRGYKSAVTSAIWKLTGSQTPVWQRNYYEHVIRNENELNEIRQYIRTNPENWENDKENPKYISELRDEE